MTKTFKRMKSKTVFLMDPTAALMLFTLSDGPPHIPSSQFQSGFPLLPSNSIQHPVRPSLW